MKICPNILHGTQVYDPVGTIRLCCNVSYFVGRLTENTMEEIWNGERARYVFEKLANGDYSLCNKESCRYLNTEENKVPLVEIDEIPKYPTDLSLSYEEVCNYRCSVCVWPDSNLFNKNDADIEAAKKAIGKNLETVLPHLKRISANGCGELFASKHTLELLANWRPVSPHEELSVRLESNGSLFNEKNWKKIENLGQYNLRVDITVMSFDEHTYQVLSGVKYPVSRIENNLRFVKSLREKGIINHLQIATVIQERNFRMLPTFVRRCIEEFGADSVRLRPYVPNLNHTPETVFITDVKNTKHPHHQEYLEILKDPIFKHPKVEDWGTINENYAWDIQYKTALIEENKLRKLENNVLSELIINDGILNNLQNYIKINKGSVVLYGGKPIGLSVAKKLMDSGCLLNYIIDFEVQGNFFGVPVVNPQQLPPPLRAATIFFTDVQVNPNVLYYLRNLGYSGKFIGLQALLEGK